MSDIVVDSSVVAKWILPEPDSAQSKRLITEVAQKGERLIVLDLVFVEVANAIWKPAQSMRIFLKSSCYETGSGRGPRWARPFFPTLGARDPAMSYIRIRGSHKFERR
jgi:hypothetical protein